MQPHIQPLSLWQRKLVFALLFVVFFIMLPVFIFYASGYRYDFSATSPSFTATGAFYIEADAPESTIYLDDVAVKNVRSFRSASYLQDIEPGIHRVHVQAPGAHTWVKELPVTAHIVTEAEAFNLPVVPQVRVIPEYVTALGEGVVFPHSSSTPVLAYVGSSTPLWFATSTATSSYRSNQEFNLLRELFAEQASATAARKEVLARQAQRFGFSTSSTDVGVATSTEIGTTTVSRDNVTLFEREGNVYARAESSNFRQVPHYFCAPYIPESDLLQSSSVSDEVGELDEELEEQERSECRDEILVSRQGQSLTSFDFYPTNSNLVLMHLTEGIYVVEIDDRAWQNMQPLYLGHNLELLLYRGGMYVREGELIFEILSDGAAG